MTEVNFPPPKYLLDIATCEIIYKTFRQLAEEQKIPYPLPEFQTRYKGRLESLLGAVNLRSYLLNEDTLLVGARYFTQLARNQAFIDGNKRMAVLFSSSFFFLNGFELNIKQTDFARIALAVSRGDSDVDEIVMIIYEIFLTSIKPIDNS